ncbi:AAA family ATPase [Novacetimonas maltaceti]|uniref:AAA+ ATPase domain-containing protein n=1 Tax=Novacetimonas maltaceti TaxID=1203393 RepID=A0A2S3W4R3_9PROT|nr:AAA family ATPase [Novacetimonas maltaceti]POF63563.1 hypothetical protein KMAL_07430 [Novacetimonas maltaceti]
MTNDVPHLRVVYDSEFDDILGPVSPRVCVTTYRDVYKPALYDTQEMSLSELADMVRQPVGEAKDNLPLIKLARVNGKRGNDSILSVSGVEVDYDAGEITPQEARKRLNDAGIAALVYTTPTHTPGHPKWRILAPLSQEHDPKERERFAARIIGLFDGKFDPASYVLGQSYFIGQTTSGNPVETFQTEGQCIDEAHDLDRTARWKDDRQHVDNATPAPGDKATEADLLRDIFTGENYHASMVRLGGIWAKAGIGYVDAIKQLERVFGDIPADQRDQRWHDRRKTIETSLIYAYGRDAAKEHHTADDLFDDDDVSDQIEAAPASGHGRLTILTPGQCQNLPPKPYVVKGLLAAGDVACIFGAPGAGKSMIAPYLGYMIAQGKEAFGSRTKAGTVMYVAAEDEHGMRSRVTALMEQHGTTDDFLLIGGVSNLGYSVDSRTGKVDKSDDLTRLKELVRERKPSIVFIDTLAMAFPDITENDSESMVKVVRVARYLAKSGCAVVLIHHDTKADNGTPRGHSVLNGALDMALHVKAKDQNGVINGKLTKNRNGTCDRQIAFKIAAHEIGTDEDGDQITAGYCEPCSNRDGATPLRLSPQLSTARDILIEMEREAPDKPIRFSDWKRRCTESAGFCASNDAAALRQALNRTVTHLSRLNLIIADKAKDTVRTAGQESIQFGDEDVM